MRVHSEDTEVVEEAPASQSKISIVIGLAMLLGILLTVIAVGAYFHFQTIKALDAQLLAVDDALKEKDIAIDELNTQIKLLSRQMEALKECSIARSGAAGARIKKSAGPAD